MAKPHDPLTTCLNLRCKQMFYESPESRSPEHDADIERMYGTVDGTAYWCQSTQTGRGPDEKIVGRKECSRARTCFVGIESLA